MVDVKSLPVLGVAEVHVPGSILLIDIEQKPFALFGSQLQAWFLQVYWKTGFSSEKVDPLLVEQEAQVSSLWTWNPPLLPGLLPVLLAWNHCEVVGPTVRCCVPKEHREPAGGRGSDGSFIWKKSGNSSSTMACFCCLLKCQCAEFGGSVTWTLST